MQTYWFFALMSSICLEGLGRRYLSQVPNIVFYLVKDGVLLWGYLAFRTQPGVVRVSKYLYRGFTAAWLGTFMWTIIEVANPEQPSFVLAALGLRAYWLWWLAPPVIASVLQNSYHRRRAIYSLAYLAIGISALAALQFVSPADSGINVYSVVDGDAQAQSGSVMVYSTGRARVASTFSFVSGFSDFTILVPVLLLSLGLETSDKRLRKISLIATMCTAVALPMSGSRVSVVLGVSVLVITCWCSGLFFTRTGRRILLGGLVGIALGAALFLDAILGVQSRFADSEETQSRFATAATVLPPFAMATLDYPMSGIGTGMMQNAASSLHVYTDWGSDLELHRYLIELGPVGFCLMWVTKLGLMVAFIRAYSVLKQAGRRSSAGAALSYAAVTFFGNITFDHIWQALYFVGAGFILAETNAALERRRTNEQATVADVGPPAVALSR